MKPTKTVIGLSKKLWGKGVRKEIEVGNWYLDSGILSLNVCRTYRCDISEYKKFDLVPIWTDPDECIEWLRGKGWRMVECIDHDKGFVVVIQYADRTIDVDHIPTLIEALLKAMVEVKKNE